MWQYHRSMIRPFFARDKLIQYSIFEKTANKAISLMTDRLKSGHSVDIQDLSSRYTFDSTTEFLFSMDFDYLGETLPYPYFAIPTKADEDSKSHLSKSQIFLDAFGTAQYAVSSRVQLGSFWPLREFAKNWTVEPMRIVESYLSEMIEKNARNASELKGVDEEDHNLLDELTKSTDS